MDRILFVKNPHSGLVQDESEVEVGIAHLRGMGHDVSVVSLEEVAEPISFTRYLEEWKPRIVVAVGGDGTVNLIVQYLIETDMRFAVIPQGTFNHFAKHIGIPLDVESAFRTLQTGEAILVDVGEVNGHYFVNFSCVGFYTRVIKRREEHQKRNFSKWAAFVIALYETFVRFRTMRLRVSKGESEFIVETPLVFIGNNVFDFGSADVLSQRERITDGKLQLSVTANNGRFAIFLLILRSFIHDIKNSTGFSTVALDAVRIDSRRKEVSVSLDGEVREIKTPLYYRSRPLALSVIVPRST